MLGLTQPGAARMANQATFELLDAFADAFNRHDTDALMGMMTPDCVFDASAGGEVFGTRFEGQEAVRAGFDSIFGQFADAQWNEPAHFITGDRGVTEWRFTATGADGKRTEVHGCDVFTFRDGKILVKNSYRKNRPPF